MCKFSDDFINYSLQIIFPRGPIWLKTCSEIIATKGTKTNGVKRWVNFLNTLFRCFASDLAEKNDSSVCQMNQNTRKNEKRKNVNIHQHSVISH